MANNLWVWYNTGESGAPETTATADIIGLEPADQEHEVGTILSQAYASDLRKIGIRAMTTLGAEVQVEPASPHLLMARACTDCLLADCEKCVAFYTHLADV